MYNDVVGYFQILFGIRGYTEKKNNNKDSRYRIAAAALSTQVENLNFYFYILPKVFTKYLPSYRTVDQIV